MQSIIATIQCENKSGMCYSVSDSIWWKLVGFFVVYLILHSGPFLKKSRQIFSKKQKGINATFLQQKCVYAIVLRHILRRCLARTCTRSQKSGRYLAISPNARATSVHYLCLASPRFTQTWQKKHTWSPPYLPLQSSSPPSLKPQTVSVRHT